MTTEDLNQIRQIIREEIALKSTGNVSFTVGAASPSYPILITQYDLQWQTGTIQCAHEWESIVNEWATRGTSYWQCRKCNELRDTSPNEQNNESK